jgi:serine/threonine protein kinase
LLTCPTCHQRYLEGTLSCPEDGTSLQGGVLVEESKHGHSQSNGAFAASELRTGAEAELVPGSIVGEYVVEAKLGEGGFGSVYQAKHPVIGKQAAIKVLHRALSTNTAMVARFVNEARVVNQIKHRNIVDIFAFGTLADGRQYFVMELLQGRSLGSFLRARGHLAPAEVLPIFKGVAKALDAAHKAGVVHRDLTPENVFISDEDGVLVPKLLDFGIAKLLGEPQAPSHKTAEGVAIGTVHYMSPEQCHGRADVDHRTDIYAYGCILFEVLTGRVPFDGDSALAIMTAHLGRDIPSVSRALDVVFQRLLAKDKLARPETTSDGYTLLERAIELPLASTVAIPAVTFVSVASAATTEVEVSSPISLPTKSRRSPWLFAVALTATAAIAAAVWRATAWSSTGARSDGKSAVTTSLAPFATAPTPSSSPSETSSVRVDFAFIALKDCPRGLIVRTTSPGVALSQEKDRLRLEKRFEPVELELSAPGHAQRIATLVPASTDSLRCQLKPLAQSPKIPAELQYP